MSSKLSSTKYEGKVKRPPTKTEQIEKLKGYKPLPQSSYKKIKPGDKLRYETEGKFRYGGVVKINNFPKYIVLLNTIKNLSWCVQYNDPSLKIYLKSLENIKKENKERNDIYEKWKKGELCEKKR